MGQSKKAASFVFGTQHLSAQFCRKQLALPRIKKGRPKTFWAASF